MNEVSESNRSSSFRSVGDELQLSSSSSFRSGGPSRGGDSVSSSSNKGPSRGGLESSQTHLDPTEKESRRIFYLKLLVIAVLVVAAASTAVTVFFLTVSDEEEEFQQELESIALQISKDIRLKVEAYRGDFERLALAITGYALGTKMNWPFVTLPDFEIQGQAFRLSHQADWVAFAPFVVENQTAWERYSEENAMSWLENSFLQEGTTLDASTITNISPEIQPSVTEEPSVDNSRLPVWQISPGSPHISMINQDFLMTPNTLEAVSSIRKTPETMYWSSSTSYSAENEDDWPRLDFATPIFDTAYPQTKLLVGVLFSRVGLHKLMDGISVPKKAAIELHVEDSCANRHRYGITNDGLAYISEGWLGSGHVHAEHPVSGSILPNSIEDCSFGMHISALAEYKDAFVTSAPIYFAGGIAGIFILMVITFIIYDSAVERRQTKEMESAEKPTDLIKSLFPAQVMERVMNENAHVDDDPKRSLALHGYFEKLFPSVGDAAGGNQSMVIADTYPDTTIMFCDIANFTAWSSEREPSQVFTLLECIYKSFDDMAKSKGIFKVETIGDCYVAVAGCPEPRPDHAIVMAKFSRACCVEIKSILRGLEILMGPGTSDLSVRVGLHSGVVTAGVLRGEKSRFQLYGDTVHMASAMEATGEPMKVHISEATAQLLRAEGKGHWLKSRKHKHVILPKFSNTPVQTYWLAFSVENQDHVSSQFTSGNFYALDHEVQFILEKNGSKGRNVHSVLDQDKINRMVAWNVEMLMRLLQKTVAIRQSLNHQMEEDNQLSKGERNMTDGLRPITTPLEEVVEIIQLPTKSTTVGRTPAISSVTFDPIVRRQLADFVRTISTMYRNNPFHNFEHASHVVQAITKFLSRVVTSDRIDYGNMTYEQKGSAQNLHEFTYGLTSDPLVEFACAFSALIHDVDHLGVPNATLVSEKHDMAQVYNDKSVAEQNSVEVAWELLMEDSYKELRNVIFTTPEELCRFRQLVVNSVMATDISDKELGASRKKRWYTAFQGAGVDNSNHGELEAPEESELDKNNRKATIVIEHLIQASDVAHTMQHWHIYIKWNEHLFQECYLAYLNGRAENDPSKGWYKGEIGFFDFYVIPLAKKLEECGVFGVSSAECYEYARLNREEWEQKGEKIVEQYVKNFHAHWKDSRKSMIMPRMWSVTDQNGEISEATEEVSKIAEMAETDEKEEEGRVIEEEGNHIDPSASEVQV